MSYKRVFLFLISFLLLYCSNDLKENIVAKVGDRNITVFEFKKRAELTARPPYCNGKSEVDKGIILNTLIAEKLLALEGSKDSALTGNQTYKNYVLGVKEQKMRKRLVEIDLDKQLEISLQEKQRALKQAVKKIHVAYLFSADLDQTNEWMKSINNSSDFDRLEKKVNAGKKPHLKEVIWGENLEAFDKALFIESVAAGDIVGPVETKIGYYIFKIIDIRSQAVIGQTALDEKLAKIEGVLFQRKWNAATARYVYQLMKDKDIKLDDKGFSVLERYYRPQFTAEDLNDENLQENKNKEENKADIDNLLKENMRQPLMTIDGEIITIAGFIQMAKKRPLLFSSSEIDPDLFKFHLKAAIKDLLTDKYLTQRAYDGNLDIDSQVLAEEKLWSDHLLATGKKAMLLNELGYDGSFANTSDSYYEIINMLRPQLNIIAKKYDVDINLTEYNKIKISDIQLLTVQEGMPYPKVVPSFPVITNDERPALFQ